LSVPGTSVNDPYWMTIALEALRDAGCVLITDVLSPEFLERTRQGLYKARASIISEIGEARLRAAGEIGTYRLLMKFDPHFFEYLSLPTVLAIVDATVGETAILHLQNGFILPPLSSRPDSGDVFQTTFHRDFPRYLNGYLASVNVFFAIDAFTEENGATLVVPGSHQHADTPDQAYMKRCAVPAVGPAGSLLLFDSTLWHAAGPNRSSGDRLAINHQFTRSYIKQQVDYVRALGEETILAIPSRTQQLLGWYTRVVTSLDEYYRPEQERLYRRGQG
jgi:ectoine hydroxylase-related dioxygenase (phytanoyl-CoA dioxygenase family)